MTWEMKKEDNFLITVPHDNEIDLPDGFYKAVKESTDWYADYSPDAEWRDYFSKTLVPVRSKLISIRELVQATSEIKQDCGYHGKYLESVKYCADTNSLRISIGS